MADRLTSRAALGTALSGVLAGALISIGGTVNSVSYTHLTLPTICSV